MPGWPPSHIHLTLHIPHLPPTYTTFLFLSAGRREGWKFFLASQQHYLNMARASCLTACPTLAPYLTACVAALTISPAAWHPFPSLGAFSPIPRLTDRPSPLQRQDRDPGLTMGAGGWDLPNPALDPRLDLLFPYLSPSSASLTTLFQDRRKKDNFIPPSPNHSVLDRHFDRKKKDRQDSVHPSYTRKQTENRTFQDFWTGTGDLGCMPTLLPT